jgi:hypothetical protein
VAHHHGAVSAASKPAFEVADIFRQHGPEYRRRHVLTERQAKAMSDIEQCRTAALGGHMDVCDSCGYSAPSYNSCGNRNCPKCQALTQAKWIQKQEESILPIHYFHGVITLPAQIRPLALANQRIIYNLLFRCAADTLLTLGRDPKHLGALIGFIAVLHTWNREMLYHPHLHLIIPGGGFDQNGRWVSTKEDFFIHGNVISKLFQGKFLHALNRKQQKGLLKGTQAEDNIFPKLRDQLYKMNWNAYAKRPFGGPENVFRYLGRYIHRVAISNQRLIAFDENGVTFHTKEQKTVTVAPDEFIRRFLLHVLPYGFTKIRRYGLLAPSNAQTKLPEARRQLEKLSLRPSNVPDSELQVSPSEESWAEFYKRLTGIDLFLCPECGQGRLKRRPLVIGDTFNEQMLHPQRGP